MFLPPAGLDHCRKDHVRAVGPGPGQHGLAEGGLVAFFAEEVIGLQNVDDFLQIIGLRRFFAAGDRLEPGRPLLG